MHSSSKDNPFICSSKSTCNAQMGTSCIYFFFRTRINKIVQWTISFVGFPVGTLLISRKFPCPITHQQIAKNLFIGSNLLLGANEKQSLLRKTINPGNDGEWVYLPTFVPLLKPRRSRLSFSKTSRLSIISIFRRPPPPCRTLNGRMDISEAR